MMRRGDSDGSIRVALIGRPNAANLHLLTLCVVSEKYVSDVAGTTRIQ